MKNNKIFFIVLILAGLFIVGVKLLPHDNQIEINGGKPNSNTKVTQVSEKVAPNTVEIRKYEFTPKSLKIKKGTTITWVNNDIAPHTVTVDDENQKGPKSEYFRKGEKYTYTFSEVGTFPYHCEPHPYMKAVIEVTE